MLTKMMKTRRQWHPSLVSTFAWKIPWTEEPGRLQSMGSLRVGPDWATSLSLFTFMHWRRKWQPTPVFLPGESQEWGAWWAAVYGVAQSRTRLKWLSSSSKTNNFLINLNKSTISRNRECIWGFYVAFPYFIKTSCYIVYIYIHLCCI